MSISGNYVGGIEAALPVALTTTSKTDIYEAASGDNTQIVSSVILPNNTGSAVQVKLYYFDGTTDHVVFTKSVPANDTVIFEGAALRLRGGYKLKAEAATGNAVTVTAIISRAHYNESAA